VSTLAARLRSRARIETSSPGGIATISGRRIYILPTRYGLLFAALLVLMLIGSLNYGNNPAYLLTFFLVSMAVNAMYQTWRNLRGVQLRLLYSEPVFCGQHILLRFQLNSGDGIEHPAIQVQIDDEAAIDDLPANGRNQLLEVALPTGRRGWLYPGRVTVSSRYPLGLFRAWCYVSLEGRVLVYPKPASISPPLTRELDTSGEQGMDKQGHDDFFALRDYRHGDSPRHIDWKTLARERGLMSKQFTSPLGQPQLLDWFALSGSTEDKVSQLTRATLDAEENGIAYGLHLPGRQIEPALGAPHRHACLMALACFDEQAPG